MSLLSPCACCLLPNLAFLLLLVAFSIGYLATKVNGSSRNRKAFKYFTYVLSIGVALFAIFISILSRNEDFKQRVFAAVFSMISKSPKLDVMRCDLLSNVTGSVLELGPGPGTNFRCLKDNSKINSWTGVEPNKHFEEMIRKEKLSQNILFNVDTVWLKGEDLDVKEGSMDSAISTHVLCSVSDISSVLRQVRRALKPGGKFYFFEHTKDTSASSKLSWFQDLFAPFVTILGAGCQFKNVWEDIENLSNLGFIVNYVNTTAPIGVPLFEPHIVGVATKL